VKAGLSFGKLIVSPPWTEITPAKNEIETILRNLFEIMRRENSLRSVLLASGFLKSCEIVGSGAQAEQQETEKACLHAPPFGSIDPVLAPNQETGLRLAAQLVVGAIVGLNRDPP